MIYHCNQKTIHIAKFVVKIYMNSGYWFCFITFVKFAKGIIIIPIIKIQNYTSDQKKTISSNIVVIST